MTDYDSTLSLIDGIQVELDAVSEAVLDNSQEGSSSPQQIPAKVTLVGTRVSKVTPSQKSDLEKAEIPYCPHQMPLRQRGSSLPGQELLELYAMKAQQMNSKTVRQAQVLAAVKSDEDEEFDEEFDEVDSYVPSMHQGGSLASGLYAGFSEPATQSDDKGSEKSEQKKKISATTVAGNDEESKEETKKCKSEGSLPTPVAKAAGGMTGKKKKTDLKEGETPSEAPLKKASNSLSGRVIKNYVAPAHAAYHYAPPQMSFRTQVVPPFYGYAPAPTWVDGNGYPVYGAGGGYYQHAGAAPMMYPHFAGMPESDMKKVKKEKKKEKKEKKKRKKAAEKAETKPSEEQNSAEEKVCAPENENTAAPENSSTVENNAVPENSAPPPSVEEAASIEEPSSDSESDSDAAEPAKSSSSVAQEEKQNLDLPPPARNKIEQARADALARLNNAGNSGTMAAKLEAKACPPIAIDPRSARSKVMPAVEKRNLGNRRNRSRSKRRRSRSKRVLTPARRAPSVHRRQPSARRRAPSVHRRAPSRSPLRKIPSLQMSTSLPRPREVPRLQTLRAPSQIMRAPSVAPGRRAAPELPRSPSISEMYFLRGPGPSDMARWTKLWGRHLVYQNGVFSANVAKQRLNDERLTHFALFFDYVLGQVQVMRKERGPLLGVELVLAGNPEIGTLVPGVEAVAGKVVGSRDAPYGLRRLMGVLVEQKARIAKLDLSKCELRDEALSAIRECAEKVSIRELNLEGNLVRRPRTFVDLLESSSKKFDMKTLEENGLWYPMVLRLRGNPGGSPDLYVMLRSRKVSFTRSSEIGENKGYEKIEDCPQVHIVDR